MRGAEIGAAFGLSCVCSQPARALSSAQYPPQNGAGKRSHTQWLMGRRESGRRGLDLGRQALQLSPWKHITQGTGMIGREEMGLRGGFG